MFCCLAPRRHAGTTVSFAGTLYTSLASVIFSYVFTYLITDEKEKLNIANVLNEPRIADNGVTSS